MSIIGGGTNSPKLPSIPSSGASSAAAVASKGGSGSLSEFQPHSPTRIRIQLTIAATGVPQNAPAIPVPPGATVTLTGHKANGAANAANIGVAGYPEAFSSGARQIPPSPPGGDVEYVCDNTAEIWIQGTAGDGLLLSITDPSVG